MNIGIIAEGRADQLVLRNILYAFGIEKEDIRFLRPEFSQDEMDRNNQSDDENTRAFGSWTNVKNDCISREPFIDFFDNDILDEKYMIIQLDSDVCGEYGVQELLNIKEIGIKDFSSEMRKRIIEQINEWLEMNYTENLLYAICVRQMDAWVLTIYANAQDKDTGGITEPKSKLSGNDSYKKLRGYKIADKYSVASDKFTKQKQLKKYIQYNQSLKDFIESLEEILIK